MPDTIPSMGLLQQRKEYLFTKIKQYCPDYVKDIFCPALTAAPKSDHQSPAATGTNSSSIPSVATTSSDAPPDADAVDNITRVTRKRPTCSYCRNVEHRNSVRSGTFTCPLRRSEYET